jgi:hypothetical protein
MKWRSQSAALLVALSFGVLSPRSSSRAADASGADLLEGAKWDALGLVTGFHAVTHKKSGFEARLLEADGSASVAHNPVALFLMATKNGTSDLVEKIWRLERGVAGVRSIKATGCGIDIRVDVDHFDSEGLVHGVDRRVLHACFISPQGTLLPTVTVTEASL